MKQYTGVKIVSKIELKGSSIYFSPGGLFTFEIDCSGDRKNCKNCPFNEKEVCFAGVLHERCKQSLKEEKK